MSYNFYCGKTTTFFMIENQFRQPKQEIREQNIAGGGQDKKHQNYLEAKMRNANNPQMLKILDELCSKSQEKQIETANPYQVDSLSAYANLAVAGFWGEIFGGEESSSSSGMSSRDIQLAEIEQNNVIDLFNPNHPTNYIFFPATKHYADTNNIGSAKVFEGMDTDCVFEYFKKLTNTASLTWREAVSNANKTTTKFLLTEGRYTLGEFPAIIMRDFSCSQIETGAKYTIEFPRPMFNHVLPSSVKRVELKFRQACSMRLEIIRQIVELEWVQSIGCFCPVEDEYFFYEPAPINIRSFGEFTFEENLEYWLLMTKKYLDAKLLVMTDDRSKSKTDYFKYDKYSDLLHCTYSDLKTDDIINYARDLALGHANKIDDLMSINYPKGIHWCYAICPVFRWNITWQERDAFKLAHGILPEDL